MALKPYRELAMLDVSPHCSTRAGRDENGKKIEIPYLNWAKCKQLLHENGAESVYFTPLRDEKGSYVFCSHETANKDGRKTGCYFVSVEIHIDDSVFTMDMPLMNGTNVVYEDTLNQQRIANSHARAFVKGVAIHTGLGFHLWVEDKDTEPEDDLSGHNIMAVKKRIEQAITAKLSAGMDMADLLAGIGLNSKQFERLLTQFDNIALLESRLYKL